MERIIRHLFCLKPLILLSWNFLNYATLTGFKTCCLHRYYVFLIAAAQTSEWIKEEDRFINLIDGKLKRFDRVVRSKRW